MKPGNEVAIRKRTQIANANKTMFIWIAVASALVGSALVVGIFMTQKLLYNEKVLGEKQSTVTTLAHNNSVVDELEQEIRVLDTNAALSTVKANESDQAVQVILDALPSEANSFALGASLQNKLLTGINGLSIESLQVDPVIGIETITGDDSSVDASTGSGAASGEITFQFVVKGSQDALKAVLTNLERSIRTIEITNLRVEIQGTGPQMTVQGKAFFEPAKTIQLEDKVVKR